MVNEHISFTKYTYLMNRIAYWLVNNNKKFNTRHVYSYMNRVADYGTIIKAIKEREVRIINKTVLLQSLLNVQYLIIKI